MWSDWNCQKSFKNLPKTDTNEPIVMENMFKSLSVEAALINPICLFVIDCRWASNILGPTPVIYYEQIIGIGMFLWMINGCGYYTPIFL